MTTSNAPCVNNLIKIFFFLLLIVSGLSCSEDEKTTPPPPQINLSEVNAVALFTSVKLSYNLINGDFQEVGFLVGTHPDIFLSNADKYPIAPVDLLLTKTLEGLLPDTKYYVKAYGISNDKPYLGTETSFVTHNSKDVLELDSAGLGQRVYLKFNFTIPDDLKVFIGDKEVIIKMENNGYLSFIIPEQLVPGNQLSVSVESKSLRYTLLNKIRISKWAILADTPMSFGIRRGYLYYFLDNKIYAFNSEEGRDAGGSKPYYVYDPEIDSWKTYTPKDTIPVCDEAFFTAGGKGFCGLGYNYALNNPSKSFYEFNSSTRSWIKRKDFPGIGYGKDHERGTYVSSGNKGYVGLGKLNDVFIKEFWEYNQQTDAWTQMPDYPGDSYKCNYSFSIGDNVYIGGGTQGYGTNAFWKFNTTTKNWSQIASLPYLSIEPWWGNHISFVKDKKAYIIIGPRIAVYDSEANEWSLYSETIPQLKYLAHGFFNGTTLFVGGGESKTTGLQIHRFYKIGI